MPKGAQLIRDGGTIPFQAAGARAHKLDHSARLPPADLHMMRIKGIRHTPVLFLLLLLSLCKQTLAVINIYLMGEENKAYQVLNHFIHTLSLPVTSL